LQGANLGALLQLQGANLAVAVAEDRREHEDSGNYHRKLAGFL